MSDQQWYKALDGQQIGPLSEADLAEDIRNGDADESTLVYTAGMANWTALGDVPRLRAHLPEAVRSVLPVPAGRVAHEIDYRIEGVEMQYVEIELDPGESAVAEAGGMMYMHGGIAMETVFGDGSEAPRSGFMNKLLGAGKRLLTGESLFMTVFTNNARGKERVAFAAPYAGKILPMDLSQLGGELICQKDAFLCAAKGVSIGIAFQKKIGVGLFGGEGFIMQRLGGRRPLVSARRGQRAPDGPGAGRNAAGRYRLPRGAAAQRDLRHSTGGGRQDRAVRGRRAVPRPSHRAGPGVVAVAAPRRPDLQGGAADRRSPPG